MVGRVGTWICIDSNIQFFHCSVGEGNLSIHGYIETFGGVGTSLCMDPTIYFFNCSLQWELRCVWNQPFSFSIVWQSGNFAMHGPNHLLFQLFGKVGTSLCMDPSINFSIVWQSGNFAMYGSSHFVFQLLGGVGTWICMDRNIQFINYSVGGGGPLEIRGYIQTFSFSIVSGSGNWDMYGPKHSVFQLSRGV